LNARVALADLGLIRPTSDVLVFDWRRQAWSRLEPDDGWDVGLEFQEWDYRVVCPILPGEVTVFGDVSKYATVGDKRVARITRNDGALQFDVLGAPDTTVEVAGWAATQPQAVTARTPDRLRTVTRDAAPDGEAWQWRASDGAWLVRVHVGAGGLTRVSMTM